MAKNRYPAILNLAFSHPEELDLFGRHLSKSLRGLDPLADDDANDPLVILTHRQLLRLVMIASDTGARFERSGVSVDPVAWLMSGRHLFHGRAALDACIELKPFIRALVLHGLSLGLDADAKDVDALLLDETFEDRVASSDLGKSRPAISMAAAPELTSA